MNTPTKLGAYVLGLGVVFAGAAVVGNVAGPAGPEETVRAQGHGEHSGAGHGGGAHADAPPVPGGLQVSQDGYTLVPQATTVQAGERDEFRFTVNGPDGRPVTRFATIHGKPLHLIAVRRDLRNYQHLHPRMNASGVWSVPLELPDPGTYRIFTDFQPQGAAEQLTLGTDVTAPGDHRPEDLPKAEQTATVDGYEVRLTGTLLPGRSSRLTLSVSRDGEPVTDLEPYLGAYGHLVALRSGDLAYLHVHPDGEPGDGRTRPGPDITFHAEVPSSGAYRLYLDFQHEGKVRTAEFTAVAGQGVTVPSAEPAPPGDGHDHTH
ncbi:hypothetical protein [Thermomonospora cellulosilytica]|uniref:Secreted protein n=1 Tax=Thermomonospora cellulosilytica TaxID=1411118 RepID=A0A7W3MUS7_9ACTN|nr:hypothetical protein [Thermomonospora cellulosilytica]MBA9002322.1 hypothetical protein [Thermomonospora cellulosilytica]